MVVGKLERKNGDYCRMWFFILWFLLSVIFFLAIQYIKSEKTFKKFPPGPRRFPIFGSLPQFILAGGSIPSIAYEKFAKKYGPIFGLKLGSVPAVVLNTYEAVQSIAFNEDFQNHLDQDDKWLLSKSKGIPTGLFFTSPTHWQEQLSLGKKLLRKYGFKSHTIMEPFFISEINEFCQELRESIETNGELFRIDEQFHVVFFNVLWVFITGERREKNDPLLEQIIKSTEDFIKSGQFGGGMHSIFPELVEWFPNLTGLTAVQKSCDKWFDILELLVKKYRDLGTYKTNPTNLIEGYLRLVDEHGSQNGNPIQSIYTDFHITGLLQDILVAGIDTQSHTLKFVILCLVKYPRVQNKLRQEVRKVIGHQRTPTSDDIEKLVYTQAILLEIYRMYPVGELSLRKVWRNTKLDKYDIPKGTLVLSNLYGIGRQESVWTCPNEFKPERFISPIDGKLFNFEKLISFGFGKRPCVGESLAKRNLVLAAALLVQQFEFAEDPSVPIPKDKDIIHSITLDLPPFTVAVRKTTDMSPSHNYL